MATTDTTQPSTDKPDPLGHLPAALREAILSQVKLQDVQEHAAHDLDEQGMYFEGHLVLTERALGQFRLVQGQWQGRWTELGSLTGAKIVEGLGMNLLRLTCGAPPSGLGGATEETAGSSKDAGRMPATHEGETPSTHTGVLPASQKILAEYRFTLRHSKEVARLQRRLERRIGGKEESGLPPEQPRLDDKKVRCEKCDRVIPPWSEVCPACLSRRRVLSRLLDFVRPYKWQAIVGFSLALMATVLGLIQPGLTKPMLNDGLGTKHGGHADFSILMFYIIVMAVLMVLSSVGGAWKDRLMAKLGSVVSRDLRDRTYQHLHTLSLSFFSKRPTGSLVTRITSDSDRIWDFVAFTVVESITSVITIFGVAAAMFYFNWKLALIVLVPMPLMLFLTVYFHNKLHRGHDRLFHLWSIMTSVVSDALPGVRVIQAFSQERREVARFNQKNDHFYQGEVGMITVWTLFGPVMQFCTYVGILLVWLVGGYWTCQGSNNMDTGTLMTFTGYMMLFYRPIHTIAHMDRQLNRAATSVQRIFEILDTAPAIFSRTGAEAPPSLLGRIELRDVTFSYDGVRKVLHNVSLSVEPGEMIGLAGPSGGGKTTLVNLLCRFYDVLEGQILIDGKDVRDYDLEALRRQIGVVLQEPFLFHGTVAANIAYGHPEASLDEIIASARAANAHEFIVGFPDGYDTMVGERGHTLSGGERQRISIARAVLSNPRILILDEATSSVDTETEKLIQEALDRLVASRTTIAIAHRLSTLRKADRLVVLDKGKVIEQGSHEELAHKEGGLYAKLIKMQNEMQAIIAIG